MVQILFSFTLEEHRRYKWGCASLRLKFRPTIIYIPSNNSADSVYSPKQKAVQFCVCFYSVQPHESQQSYMASNSMQNLAQGA